MQKYFAEGMGTFLLVFIGTLAVTQAAGNPVIIALAFGVALFVVVALFGAVSGAHVNPAVSLGFWFSGDFSSHLIVPYWIAQCIGAIAASVLVFLIVGPDRPLGETLFAARLSAPSAFLLEAALSAVFVGVVLSMRERSPRQAAFVIAGALLMAHLAAVPLTGAGLNPARSLAPVVVSASPDAAAQVWVYVAGPLAGAAVAGVLRRLLLRMRRAPAS